MASRLAKTLPVAASLAAALALAAPGFAGPGDDTTPVPSANPRVPGMNEPNDLTPRLVGRDVVQAIRAQGSMECENPLPTVGGFLTSFYAYLNDGTMMPAYGDVQSAAHNVEATKTEPDKNTYLVMCNQHGPDPKYDYGTHFVYAGHESGRRDAAGQARSYVTRVNLDADLAHRVTVLASTDKAGNFLPSIDGSTWYPFSRHLLLTAEFGAATSGGVLMATPDWPSTVTDLAGIMGRGGYEGVQADGDGNVWIVEDVGGPTGSAVTGIAAYPNLSHARQPNSFVYRFVPTNKYDLTAGGKLQVLQVISKASPGNPIVFHAGMANADISSADVFDLHTYGNTFDTKWVTIHDTAVDGTTAFDANALAKAKFGTPFKRPENGNFRPGTKFKEFVFTETGDTNQLTEVGSAGGGFGGLLRLYQSGGPSANTGKLSLVYRGDAVHTGFDNCNFLTEDLLLVAEDAGDTLHGQRNALDSIWQVDCNQNYGVATAPALIRVLAEGRDASATTDASPLGLSGKPGFQNDGDNEITGLHVSDGDPTIGGVLGAKRPKPFRQGWRIFWSQQHGDNNLWEILEPRDNGGDVDCGCGDRDDDRDDRGFGRGHDGD